MADKHHGPRNIKPLEHFRGLEALAEIPAPMDATGRAYVHEVSALDENGQIGSTSLRYNVSIKPNIWLLDQDEDVLGLHCDNERLELIIAVTDVAAAHRKAVSSRYIVASHRWDCSEKFSSDSERAAPIYR